MLKRSGVDFVMTRVGVVVRVARHCFTHGDTTQR